MSEHGHVDIGSYGHVDPYGLEMWTLGHVDIWTLDIWRYKDIRTIVVVIVGEFSVCLYLYCLYLLLLYVVSLRCFVVIRSVMIRFVVLRFVVIRFVLEPEFELDIRHDVRLCHLQSTIRGSLRRLSPISFVTF